MHTFSLVLVCGVGIGHGFRVQISADKQQGISVAEAEQQFKPTTLNLLAKLNGAQKSAGAFTPHVPRGRLPLGSPEHAGSHSVPLLVHKRFSRGAPWASMSDKAVPWESEVGKNYALNQEEAIRKYPRFGTKPSLPEEVYVPARLLVLAPLMPCQRLSCKTQFGEVPAAFHDLVARSGEPLVVVGRNWNSLFPYGVEVVAQSSDDDVVLRATGRLAKIVESGEDEGSRWAGRAGTVQWIGSLDDDDYVLSTMDFYAAMKAVDHAGRIGNEEDPERLARIGASLGDLVDEWIGLVRATNREHWPSLVDRVLKELGAMPTGLNARAMYVAALLSTLPDVSYDIRPAVITADTTSRRLSLAEQGLLDSIKSLEMV